MNVSRLRAKDVPRLLFGSVGGTPPPNGDALNDGIDIDLTAEDTLLQDALATILSHTKSKIPDLPKKVGSLAGAVTKQWDDFDRLNLPEVEFDEEILPLTSVRSKSWQGRTTKLLAGDGPLVKLEGLTVCHCTNHNVDYLDFLNQTPCEKPNITLLFALLQAANINNKHSAKDPKQQVFTCAKHVQRLAVWFELAIHYASPRQITRLPTDTHRRRLGVIENHGPASFGLLVISINYIHWFLRDSISLKYREEHSAGLKYDPETPMVLQLGSMNASDYILNSKHIYPRPPKFQHDLGYFFFGKGSGDRPFGDGTERLTRMHTQGWEALVKQVIMQSAHHNRMVPTGVVDPFNWDDVYNPIQQILMSSPRLYIEAVLHRTDGAVRLVAYPSPFIFIKKGEAMTTAMIDFLAHKVKEKSRIRGDVTFYYFANACKGISKTRVFECGQAFCEKLTRGLKSGANFHDPSLTYLKDKNVAGWGNLQKNASGCVIFWKCYHGRQWCPYHI